MTLPLPKLRRTISHAVPPTQLRIGFDTASIQTHVLWIPHRVRNAGM